MPGNYGMKDQVAVLRWVRDNVAAFGGDSGQVTIFGESVGGASGGYHMMSPMSKGLFHKVILQSGAPSCNWASSVPGLGRKRTEAIVTMAGCYGENSREILNCLTKLPANLLVNFNNRFYVNILMSLNFLHFYLQIPKKKRKYKIHYLMRDFLSYFRSGIFIRPFLSIL